MMSFKLNNFSVSGCYFGTHFIMGGEKFETSHPEMFLFGENSDLNFLGNKPGPVSKISDNNNCYHFTFPVHVCYYIHT